MIRRKFNFCGFAFWAMLSIAGANCVHGQDQDPEYDIEFEFEFDICKIHQISCAASRLADMGRRMLGYDSAAYVLARKKLDNQGNRLEFILAILTILKYPSLYEPIDSVNLLIDELKITHNISHGYWFNNQLLSAKSFKNYVEIYQNLRDLSGTEFLALAWNLNDRAEFLPVSNSCDRASFWLEIKQELKDMIDALLQEPNRVG